MPFTNTLAYLASLTVTKENRFITLTFGVNTIKLFFFVTDQVSNDARVFVPGKPFKAILIIEHRVGVYPRGERLKGAPLE